jgi:methyl-accepting chemotaxis protein
MAESSSQEQHIITIGIIGGGKVGAQWLQLFGQSRITHVVFMVDRDTQAPGIVEARKAGISTFTDIDQAFKSQQVEFVFEVTGSSAVVNMLMEKLSCTSTQLITHDMAYVLINVIDENHKKTTSSVLEDILAIKKEIENSLESMVKALDDIKQTTSDLRYLSLNARIEAARAGEHGRGFDVVAQQVDGSAQSVRNMTGEISKVNTNIASVIKRIELSLDKLK